MSLTSLLSLGWAETVSAIPTHGQLRAPELWRHSTSALHHALCFDSLLQLPSYRTRTEALPQEQGPASTALSTAPCHLALLTPVWLVERVSWLTSPIISDNDSGPRHEGSTLPGQRTKLPWEQGHKLFYSSAQLPRTRENVSTEFSLFPTPFFFGGGGVELVRRQGACCPRSMFKTRCSPQSQLGKAKKTTGLKTHSFYITISPTAHSWQPSHRAQSLGYRSYSGARRLDHTNLVTLRPQDCLCVSLSGASSTWAQQYQQPNSFLVTLLVQYVNVSS